MALLGKVHIKCEKCVNFFYFTRTTVICNTDKDVRPSEHIRWNKQKKQTKNERM